MVGYTFSQNWHNVGYKFWIIGIRNGYVFEAWMASPRSIYGDLVGGTRYALSEETNVSPRAVGYSSCAVAFWG